MFGEKVPLHTWELALINERHNAGSMTTKGYCKSYCSLEKRGSTGRGLVIKKKREEKVWQGRNDIQLKQQKCILNLLAIASGSNPLEDRMRL